MGSANLLWPACVCVDSPTAQNYTCLPAGSCTSTGSAGSSGTAGTDWPRDEEPFGLPGAHPGFRVEGELRRFNSSAPISIVSSETVDITVRFEYDRFSVSLYKVL